MTILADLLAIEALGRTLKRTMNLPEPPCRLCLPDDKCWAHRLFHARDLSIDAERMAKFATVRAKRLQFNPEATEKFIRRTVELFHAGVQHEMAMVRAKEEMA